MLEKVISGEYRNEQVGDRITKLVWVTATLFGDKVDVLLPSELSLVLESDRLEALARIEELEATIAERDAEIAAYRELGKWQQEAHTRRHYTLSFNTFMQCFIAKLYPEDEISPRIDGKATTLSAAITAALAQVQEDSNE